MSVSFNEAIGIVREKFNNHYILKGFEYNGYYVFELISKKYKEMFFNQGLFVSINKINKKIEKFDPLKESFYNKTQYDESIDRAIIIDNIEVDLSHMKNKLFDDIKNLIKD